MKKGLFTLALSSLALFGAAYKIPEQSARSVALAGAYVAAAKDADASYFNPANMSFMDGYQYVELSLTGAYLPKISFSGIQHLRDGSSFPTSSSSRAEKFLIPHFHYVGPAFGKWRFGLSLTTPAGTSKRWDTSPQKWYAKRYTLRVAELAPACSYSVSENFSIGAAARVVFTDGRIVFEPPGIRYDLDGDIQTRYGYALAMSYRLKELTLSATYRSKVKLKEKGTAIITVGTANYRTTGSVTVPLPASLALAAALQINEKATFEVVYERTFWSSYERLDIVFDDLTQFNRSVPKEWSDSDTFRVGVTYKNSPRLTTMFGMAYDQTPVPSRTLGYELPDSDALIFAAGAIYALTDALKIGLSYLYDYKLDRTIELADRNINGIEGTFSNIRAHLLNLSIAYKF